jgi:hypothetical protein
VTYPIARDVGWMIQNGRGGLFLQSYRFHSFVFIAGTMIYKFCSHLQVFLCFCFMLDSAIKEQSMVAHFLQQFSTTRRCPDSFLATPLPWLSKISINLSFSKIGSTTMVPVPNQQTHVVGIHCRHSKGHASLVIRFRQRRNLGIFNFYESDRLSDTKEDG